MSNIDIKVTADVADLQTKFALAKAQTSALSTELNKLAKEANAAGGPSTELKAKMDGVASQFVATKARASDLRTELANATGGMGSFSGAIASAVPLLETFGLAISAAGIFEFAKGIVTTAADIQHQADALGIGAERLQAYQFAARESGVSVDEAGTAFKRFFANLGELQTTGEGSLAKYLSELGLTADELAGDPTEALVIFARALDKETDATIRAAAERAAFGRSGIDLNALMHKLAEGTGDVTDKVKGLEDEAKAAGQVMDNQATEGAKHFEEALDGVKVRAESGVLAIAELIHQVWELGGAEQEQMLLQERLAKRRLLPANLHPGPQGLPPVPNPTFLTPQGPDVTDPVINIAKDGGAGSNKAANDARRMADEIAQAYVQSNEKRIEGEAQTNSFLLEMGQESIGQFVEQARKLENERYAVEVEGLKKREAADAGDKVALVKDKADEEVIAREHANKLAAIDQDYGRKKKQIAETELQDFIQTKQDELTADIEGVEAQFKEHRTSAQQRHDLEHAFTADIERQVLARFDAEHVGLVKGTEAYAQAMKERQKLIDGFAKHELQQDNQLVEQEMQKWHELSSSIEGSFNGALNQMLLHGGSFPGVYELGRHRGRGSVPPDGREDDRDLDRAANLQSGLGCRVIHCEDHGRCGRRRGQRLRPICRLPAYSRCNGRAGIQHHRELSPASSPPKKANTWCAAITFRISCTTGRWSCRRRLQTRCAKARALSTAPWPAVARQQSATRMRTPGTSAAISASTICCAIQTSAASWSAISRTNLPER
jgi:hypothetical protein